MFRRVRRRIPLLSNVLFVVVAFLALATPVDAAPTLGPGGPLPLTFEPNMDQADASVKFLARGRGYGLFLTPSETVFVLVPTERTVDGRRPQPRASARTTFGQASNVTVDFATEDGTATALSDYVATTGTINFAYLQTTQRIVIPLQIEPGAQPPKSFRVRLSNPCGGATLGIRTSAEVRITDTR